MRRLFLVFACVVGLASLSRGEDKPEPVKLSDEEITKLMIGKWEDSARFGNVKIHTVENFKKDGALEREDTINDNQKMVVKATWEIKNGMLITVVVEGFPGKGTTVKGTVLSIDEKSQHLEMEAGADVKKTRVKE